MIGEDFVVGDTITIKRTLRTGTGYRYVLTHLNGGVALVDEAVKSDETLGGMTEQSFTFQFIGSGEMEIQLANYRGPKEVTYEDVIRYVVLSEEETIARWKKYEEEKAMQRYYESRNERGIIR